MIMLDNNQLSYQPGAYIKGQILVNQSVPFTSDMLELRFAGREFTYAMVPNGKSASPMDHEEFLCNISWPIAMT